jgi:hypothetical protein
MPKKDVLPLLFLELYTPLADRSCDALLAPAAEGEAGPWALDRRVWPLEAGCASFPWLLPMVKMEKVCRGRKTTASGTRRSGYGRCRRCPTVGRSIDASVRAGMRSLWREIGEWMVW